MNLLDEKARHKIFVEKVLTKAPKIGVFPDSLKKENQIPIKKNDDFEHRSVRSIVKNAKEVDDAFVSSILSYVSYDKNRWMVENLGKSFNEMKPKFVEAFFEKEQEDAQEKFFGLKIWNFLNETFEKIPDNQIRIPAQSVQMTDYKYVSDFNYKDGLFDSKQNNQKFDLAHAHVLKRKNPNGEGYILHLTYRGTEFSKLWHYIKGPYLDMQAYYENFKPLEKYIKEYVADPKNQIDEIHVSGHSLGGAMVQEFLKNVSEEESAVPIKGFTFGSPGSQKNKFHKFITTAYHAVLRGVNLAPEVLDQPTKKDPRLKEFYHSNDPIPKVGLLGYKKNGESVDLYDTVKEESQLAKNLKEQRLGKSFLEKLPIFGQLYMTIKDVVKHKFMISFHDSHRYIKNLRNLIEDHFTAYPQMGDLLGENLHNLKSWSKSERSFLALSMKYKEDFLSIIKERDPQANQSSIQKQFYEIKEQMLVDDTSEKVLAQSRRYNNQADKFFRKKTDEEQKTISEINLDQQMVMSGISSIRSSFNSESLDNNQSNDLSSHLTAMSQIAKMRKQSLLSDVQSPNKIKVS